MGGVIEATGLTKRYGDKTAVADLTFRVRPGIVTGFLGSNGAGKSTTMRLILGLDALTSGTVTINGKPYRAIAVPLREVGALLESRSVHAGPSARNHLLALAATTGVTTSRVDNLLAMVGLADVAGKWVRGFSLGMSVRARSWSGGVPPRVALCRSVSPLRSTPSSTQWVP